jgi:hypothetical protein
MITDIAGSPLSPTDALDLLNGGRNLTKRHVPLPASRSAMSYSHQNATEVAPPVCPEWLEGVGTSGEFHIKPLALPEQRITSEEDFTMNRCTTCGEDFGSIAAFDAHRVGKFPQKGPSEYTGALEKWTPAKGRRCLSVTEMEAKQFVRNGRGSWSQEKPLLAARRLRSVEVSIPQAG